MNLREIYLGFGWSIIPIKQVPGDIAASKKPALASWAEYQKRQPTLEEANAWKFENIGLVTGKVSGVVVVDEDSYKKTSQLKLNSPLQVITPRGGKHHYYRYTSALGNSVNAKLAVDIRGNGGYVLLPPSLGGNGKKYEWAHGNDLSELKKRIASLPSLPDDLLKQLQPTPTSGHAYDVLTHVTGAGEGRNMALAPMCMSLVNKHDEATAWTLLLAANGTQCNPPLPTSELEGMFRQALKKKQISPPKKPDVIQEKNWSFAPMGQRIDTVNREFMEGKRQGISTGIPSLDKLTGGIRPGEVSLYFGDTNTGKSALALNIIDHLISQNERVVYFDLENEISTTAQRLTLIHHKGKIKVSQMKQFEKDKADISEYTDFLKTAPLYVWDILAINDRFGMITFEAVKTCMEEAIKEGCKLFVIDHLHYFDEGDNYRALADITRGINDLCAKYAVSVVLIAHTRGGLKVANGLDVKAKRPTLDDVLGSKLITKHCKTVVGLLRNHNATDHRERTRAVCFVDKTKYGGCGMFDLKFDEETLRFIDESAPLTRDNPPCNHGQWQVINDKLYVCEICHQPWKNPPPDKQLQTVLDVFGTQDEIRNLILKI